MIEDERIRIFLGQYDKEIVQNVMRLREIISTTLPGIKEQVDLPARIITYVYGRRYSDIICTIIPSKSEIKLGFYKGAELRDPQNILEGKGKISRYVQIKSKEQIDSPDIRTLIENVLEAYKLRIETI